MAAGEVLIDTCVIVDFSRGRREAREFLDQLTGALFVSVMSAAELFGGVREGRERAWLDGWLNEVIVVPIDAATARTGGLFWRDYRASHGTGLIDALIAATAHHHRLRLATRNARHFPMVRELLVPYP